LRLAAPTPLAFTIGMAHRAANFLPVLKGEWAKARSLIEHWIGVVRTGNVVIQLPTAFAASAWVLAHFGQTGEALERLREGEQFIERQAASGILVNRGPSYHGLGRASLLLGRLHDAWRLANHAVESSSSQPACPAHALPLLAATA